MLDTSPHAYIHTRHYLDLLVLFPNLTSQHLDVYSKDPCPLAFLSVLLLDSSRKIINGFFVCLFDLYKPGPQHPMMLKLYSNSHLVSPESSEFLAFRVRSS